MDRKILYDTVYRRRSVRKYKGGALSRERISEIEREISALTPLYPGIKYEIKHLGRGEVRTMMPWMPEDAFAIFSEPTPGYLENAGFILEMLDLALQAMGLGTCWVGLGRPKDKLSAPSGMEFVMLLSVGETEKPMREGEADFNRKSLADIADGAYPALNPARLAPSSVNSQPWYFVRVGEGCFDVYRKILVRTSGLSRMNKIDVGIAIAHLAVANEGFSIEKRECAPAKDGQEYIATVYGVYAT